MMRAACVAVCLAASAANADVSSADKDAMGALMAEYGAALLDGTAPDFFVARFHPETWPYLATQQGKPADSEVEQLLEGTRDYFGTLDFLTFDLVAKNAVYGEVSGWSWGMFPSERTFQRYGQGPINEECGVMFVFGQNDTWYISGTGPAQTALPEIIPALGKVSFDDIPDCAEPIS